MTDPRDLRLTFVPLDELSTRERADNPKLHDEAAILASLDRAGYVTPVVMNDLDDRLLAGHGRIEALRALKTAGALPPAGVRVGAAGEWLVPTIRGVSLGPEDASAFLVADNRTVELGGWDENRLTQILLDLDQGGGLAGVGYDREDLDRLVCGLLANIDRQALDPDEMPDGPEEEITVRFGDRYALGVHTLACGDSRSADLWAQLLGGRKAWLLLTDPP